MRGRAVPLYLSPSRRFRHLVLLSKCPGGLPGLALQ